ncbi:MAG: hypothetical protein ACOYON_16060 [Fimbriimonas sp.]
MNGTYSSFRHEFNDGNKYGYQAIRVTVIVCPNDQCREYAIVVFLHDHIDSGEGYYKDMEAKREWRLTPDSEAKVFPSYIPQPILDDYREACLICDLSPKAPTTYRGDAYRE